MIVRMIVIKIKMEEETRKVYMSRDTSCQERALPKTQETGEIEERENVSMNNKEETREKEREREKERR